MGGAAKAACQPGLSALVPPHMATHTPGGIRLQMIHKMPAVFDKEPSSLNPPPPQTQTRKVRQRDHPLQPDTRPPPPPAVLRTSPHSSDSKWILIGQGHVVFNTGRCLFFCFNKPWQRVHWSAVHLIFSQRSEYGWCRSNSSRFLDDTDEVQPFSHGDLAEQPAENKLQRCAADWFRWLKKMHVKVKQANLVCCCFMFAWKMYQFP